VLTGDSNNNLLFGMGGGDTLNGGDGNDTLFAFDTPINGTFEFLNGGFGVDTVDYMFANTGVTATMGPAASDGTNGVATFGSTTDIFNRIENLSGSAFADTLTGDHGNNVINGRGGDDIMSGGDGGINTFVFHRGDGRDTILDFGPTSIDIFEIHDGIFATAADALHASRQSGADVIIDLGGGQQITVKNTALSKLSEFNFSIVQDGPASGSPASSPPPTDSSVAQLVQAMSSFAPPGGDAMAPQMPIDPGSAGMIATPLHG
jgi:Ca2+-binding RTX toxin-like protein